MVFTYTLPAQAADDDYRLAAGDVVKIVVFQEDDLSVSATINSSGHIEYPFIGEIELAGMTLDEAWAHIDELLRGDYLNDPEIRVTIDKYRPFFITGAIRSPGSHEYRPGLTARQAIAIAGDFTPRASRRKVYIIRYGDPEFKEEKVSLDDKVGPGDTIRVKESLF
jgi:polysaccharide export outer membrane protein